MLQTDHSGTKNWTAFDFFGHLKVIGYLVKRTSSTLLFHSIIISVVVDLHVVLLAVEAAVVVTFTVAAVVINVVISEVAEEGVRPVVVVIIKILVEAVVMAICVMLNAITSITPMPLLVVKNPLVVRINLHMVKMVLVVI